MANNRKSRKEELLAAARDRLTEEANGGKQAPEIRYRGQVVRPGGSGGTPGSGIGNGSGRSRSRGGGQDTDVRAALQKIKDLYRDGLISRAEAEKKRSEILDRL